jgi:nitrite reductase/ring-hydroxylating ferredoxin subunit
LAEGRLDGNIVTCPWHGARFDITTGQCHAGPATRPVTTYPVIVEGSSIFIELT